jgi:myo-inositol-1(or 4)-monophosphatase
VLVAGLIYNPAMDELYTAERGGGAFLNDRRLRVAARRNLNDCVIGTGVPHLGRGDHGRYLVELRNVMGEVSGIRRMGAAALDLAYVAAGRLDGFWEDNLHPWDMAAGMLIIREAGGFVSDKEGGQAVFDTGGIVAGNEAIHGALLKALKKPLRAAG